ncbi:MAG: hypothetical protein Q4D45_09620 [Lachnospiraceae bacterium]|nr:hypothetical protein [Lachnospiraceae bacterium]
MRKSFLDEKYRPTGESISKESKISVACGIISILVYGVLIMISYKMKGNAGNYLGFFGWVLIFMSIVGGYYAIETLNQPNGRVDVKVLGLILNGVMLIVLLAMLIGGIA